MKLESNIAIPIANALRVLALANTSGVLGIIADSSVQIGGAEMSPQKLLSFLREVTFSDAMDQITIVSVTVKQGTYSRQTIVSQLPVAPESVDSEAIGVATSDFSIKVILGRHTSFAPITRDKVVDVIQKAGYSIDKAVLIPFPILSNKTVYFQDKNRGDGFMDISFVGADEATLVDLLKAILEGSTK